MKREPVSANPREEIVKVLREHPEGLTIKDIAGLTGSHRHTITKYVYELIGARVILERDVGAAKLCYLMETYRGKEAQGAPAMKGTLGFRQPWKAQAQLLTLLVALLLVPAGMIAAQSFGNSTVTDGMAVAADGMTGSADGSIPQGEVISNPAADENASGVQTLDDTPLPDATQASGGSEAEVQSNETTSDDEAAIDTGIQNVTAEEPANETVPYEDINVTEGNEGNETAEEPVIIPEENVTIPEANVTVPEANETLPEENETLPEANETVPDVNETQPEANATIPDENVTEPAVNITPAGIAAIEIFIENPGRITRGEDFTARAVVRNAGDGPAQNAVLEWILPEGFSVAAGNAVEIIGTIAAGEEKSYEVLVSTSIATARGASEIRARVTYE